MADIADKVTSAIKALDREKLETFVELVAARFYWQQPESRAGVGHWDPEKEWDSACDILEDINDLFPQEVTDAIEAEAKATK